MPATAYNASNKTAPISVSNAAPPNAGVQMETARPEIPARCMRHSYNPAPRISTPLTSSEMPMKNQIETDLPVAIVTAYQKMMFSTTNMIATMAAQNSGF